MMIRIKYLTLLLLLLQSAAGYSQTEGYPAPPGNIKSYKGVPGKITKYNNFNYLDMRDESSQSNRQAMGNYWEISYNYDSTFRQKRKFKSFLESQIAENGGSLLFQDTVQVQFVIPADGGNIWGKLVLSNDKVYRLRLIREVPFRNAVSFDKQPTVVFGPFVNPVPLPPRINYLPGSSIARIQQSKYDHQEFTWNLKDTLFRQKVMGPYWDMKIEVRNDKDQIDRYLSSVEILESYYRACTKAGGKVLKSRPKELLFTLPLEGATLWCRITVSLDGVYFVRALIESDRDKGNPDRMLNVAAQPADSTQMAIDR